MAALDRLRIPIWREGRAWAETASLARDPVLRGQGVPRGSGQPVLLIPGFLAGDLSMAMMSRWLRRIGYAPCRAGIQLNVDCTTRALDRLEAQLERSEAEHGGPVTIVGQSRGGTFARALAVRRPDVVGGVITLGSPIVDQMAVHPFVKTQINALGLLGTLGMPGLFSYGCGYGDCCAVARAQVSGPFPEDVDLVAVYSRTDGIVDWRSCLDPAARQVEVESTHLGMAVNPQVLRVVAEALASAHRLARAVAA